MADISNPKDHVRHCHHLASVVVCVCKLFTFQSISHHALAQLVLKYIYRGHRGRDRMVVGLATTYAISAYHHLCCEFESRSGRGVQHYVLKFVSDLRQVCGFLQVLWFPPPIKLTPRYNRIVVETKQTNTYIYNEIVAFRFSILREEFSSVS